ncbi:MAG: FeoB small GTPase domain-containing protein, partial [Flavobacteriales bacterium]
MKNNNKTKPLTVALAGNPNSGKSTLFNELTGMRQKIGNYSGVTVEKMAGICQLHTDTGLLNAKIIDLPGAYSLHPDTTDEIIASDILTDENHPDHPDLTVFIADASNLRRSLILCTQIKDMGMPVILVLNMMDVASKRGITIDPSVLSNRLKLGVVMINARTGEGVEKLKRELSDFHALPHTHLKLKEDPSTAGTIARYGKID